MNKYYVECSISKIKIYKHRIAVYTVFARSEAEANGLALEEANEDFPSHTIHDPKPSLVNKDIVSKEDHEKLKNGADLLCESVEKLISKMSFGEAFRTESQELIAARDKYLAARKTDQ